MSKYHGNDRECPNCGITYGRFRTGFRYRDVVQMLWDYSNDPSDWKYKRRGTILGNWHKIKLDLFARHLDECKPVDEVPF